MIDKIPIRRKYSVRVKKDHELLFTFHFMEATMQETLLSYKNDRTIWEILQEMMETSGEYWPEIETSKDKDAVLAYILHDAKNIYQNITEKMYAWYNSMYDGIERRREKWEKKRKGYIGSMMMSICQKRNTTLLSLLNDYTFKQVMWMYDACVFESFEMSKTWQVANDKALWSDKDLEQKSQAIDDEFEFLEKMGIL